ncbi:MAG: dephospho-CoA kinase [Paludibacteraceae bacterium]|nr:dephospho-CoA kinase [Paludibacteraceae bacterium]
MQIVGITGGIGSGKSTIARELSRRGFAVYDCDQEAKRIIAENTEVQKAIIALLGEEAFVGGQYNTSYVAQRAFAEPELLKRLNAIVHPAVLNDLKDLKDTKDLLFVESAILFEAGLDKLCDQVVCVDAPEEVRIARTMARDHCDEAHVRARMRRQTSAFSYPHSDQKKTIVLMNDGSQSIEGLVDSLIAKL